MLRVLLDFEGNILKYVFNTNIWQKHIYFNTDKEVKRFKVTEKITKRFFYNFLKISTKYHHHHLCVAFNLIKLKNFVFVCFGNYIDSL